MKKIELELKNNTAWIWFHDPRGLNTMDGEYLTKISEIIPQLKNNNSLRSVVFATTAQHFSVGLDLKEVGMKTPEEVHQIAAFATQAFSDVANIKVPTLALFQGLTVGGAIEMTAPCDFRFAADDTKIVVPGVKIGIFNPAHLMYHLPRLIGYARAAELCIRSKMIDAKTALDWGLVTEIHSKADLISAGEKWSEEINSLDPLGVEVTKKLLQKSFDSNKEEYQKIENAELERCFKRPHVVELMKNALKK